MRKECNDEKGFEMPLWLNWHPRLSASGRTELFVKALALMHYAIENMCKTKLNDWFDCCMEIEGTGMSVIVFHEMNEMFSVDEKEGCTLTLQVEDDVAFTCSFFADDTDEKLVLIADELVECILYNIEDPVE